MRTREYSTDELLLIANNVTGEYTDKQVRQAKLELYNRGVDDKVIADIMEEPDDTGVRVEDLVLVTEDGCEVLNHYPKELQIIG